MLVRLPRPGRNMCASTCMWFYRASILNGAMPLTSLTSQGDHSFALSSHRCHRAAGITVFLGQLQIEEHRAREAEAELEGVTWQPEISRMARALKRPGDEERWNYLARTAIHKNRVRRYLKGACTAGNACRSNGMLSTLST